MSSRADYALAPEWEPEIEPTDAHTAQATDVLAKRDPRMLGEVLEELDPDKPEESAKLQQFAEFLYANCPEFVVEFQAKHSDSIAEIAQELADEEALNGSDE